MPHEYLLAKMTQVIQGAYFLYLHEEKCFFLSRTQANQVYSDQTAPEEQNGLMHIHSVEVIILEQKIMAPGRPGLLTDYPIKFNHHI